MTKPTQVPGIPKSPADVSPQTRAWLDSVAEALEIRLGRRGDPRDRAITLRELVDSGLAEELKANPFDPNNINSTNIGLTNPRLNLNVPPAPVNFSASAAYSQIHLSWDYPNYSNHAFTEIYGHSSDVIGDARLLGISSGLVYIDPIGSGQSQYYWIRHVSTSDVIGPFNNGTGTLAQTATDVAHQLNVLSGAITSNELAQSLATPINNLPSNTNSELSSLQSQINTLSTVAAWASGTSYILTDLVTFNGNLYEASQAHTASSSNQPSGSSSNNSYWTFVGAYTSLAAAVAGNTSNINDINFISSSSNSAAAVAISGLNTTVAGNSTSIATQASSINGLQGQYSVKIDNNGHISGFGLSSTSTTAGPTSAFIVRADKFAVIDPSDTGDGLGTTTPSAGNVPFFIDSGDTYIKSAMIKDASITNAKVGSLSADKITFGTMLGSRIATNSISASRLQLDSNVLTQASNGELILQTSTTTNGRGIKTENLSYDATGAQHMAVQPNTASLSNSSVSWTQFTASSPFHTASIPGYFGVPTTVTLGTVLQTTVSNTKLKESGTYFINFGGSPIGNVSSSSSTQESMMVLGIETKSPSSSTWSHYASYTTPASSGGTNVLGAKLAVVNPYLSASVDHRFTLYGHLRGFSPSSYLSQMGYSKNFIQIFRSHRQTECLRSITLKQALYVASKRVQQLMQS